MADLALGGWAGMPDATTVFPSRLEIDYIKALQRVNAGGANPNLLRNPGFEADLTNWSSYGGAALSTNGRTGLRSIRISSQGGASQDVTGLSPHTVSRLRGYVRSATGAVAMLGVKDYGAQQLQNYVTSSSWTLVSLVFSTGNTTTARIFAYQAAPGGDSFYDDLILQVL
jgi:hypothetical protein